MAVYVGNEQRTHSKMTAIVLGGTVPDDDDIGANVFRCSKAMAIVLVPPLDVSAYSEHCRR